MRAVSHVFKCVGERILFVYFFLVQSRYFEDLQLFFILELKCYVCVRVRALQIQESIITKVNYYNGKVVIFQNKTKKLAIFSHCITTEVIIMYGTSMSDLGHIWRGFGHNGMQDNINIIEWPERNERKKGIFLGGNLTLSERYRQ